MDITTSFPTISFCYFQLKCKQNLHIKGLVGMKTFLETLFTIRWFFLTCFILFSAQSQDGDRLIATGGVVEVEGSAGGGLNPWALITGYGTNDQIGASANYTKARTNGGFEIDSGGFGVGFYNRLEITFNQTKFGLSDTVPNESIKLDTLGVKLRLLGDAVYDQDSWLPQIATGIQFKKNEDFNLVPKLVGGQHSKGIDFYLSGTKLYLDALSGKNILLNFNLRATKANQFGLLGFGGDKHDSYSIKPELSAALMLTDNLFLGSEYRAKPDNIKTFKENNANDFFLTWFPSRNISITTAYVDLGNIANKDNQTAWYLSGQLSY
jgi:hypothetical protein